MTTRACRLRHIHTFEGERSRRLLLEAEAAQLDRWIAEAEADIRDLEQVVARLRGVRAEKGD
ncbi:hypothetical protein ACFYX8_35290 [Streptomyces cyaneofuscatus]|uniref:hypothetical protein n=1 Tax=Streptomyces cyaneofuscatus TaxID=66883 RepID=UPI00369266E1